MRNCFWTLLMFWALSGVAAERRFDFVDVREGQTPPGFRSAVTGGGKPGEWKIVLDEVQTALQTLTPGTPSIMRRAVLAQLAEDPADEHFPLLIYEDDVFGDFTLTTKIKMVRGAKEQMAGLAFRIQNETNFYVVRASSLGNNFRFYKVVNGIRGPLVGPELPVPKGVWHELQVECKGIEIKCRLDGNELISVTDKVNPFIAGKLGFWTKSDSVSYFEAPKIVYTPREAPVQKLLREAVKNHPRLLGLQVYVAAKEPGTTRLIASKDETEIGKPGTQTEREVLKQGGIYYLKSRDSVTVIMPLRDRNGDPIAAVRLMMKTFAGQTEQNAVVRATPIVSEIQGQIQSLEDLVD